MFVHPSQIAAIVRRHRRSRARLVVDNPDGNRMTLNVEMAGTAPAAGRGDHPRRDEAAWRSRLSRAGRLPNDGRLSTTSGNTNLT
jgi:hypothetical protein